MAEDHGSELGLIFALAVAGEIFIFGTLGFDAIGTAAASPGPGV